MKVLLHICCGVCAAGVVERLKQEGHEVSGFFYNPNIHPEEEYVHRLDVARSVARELDITLDVPPYNPEEWYTLAGKLEKEPEGGKRCQVCYRLRLTRTFQFMGETECDVFTTTLTVSPNKKADIINRIGIDIGGDRFLPRDFKKKEGFKRSNEMVKEWGLYRQHYCGCLYSIPAKKQDDS